MTPHLRLIRGGATTQGTPAEEYWKAEAYAWQERCRLGNSYVEHCRMQKVRAEQARNRALLVVIGLATANVVQAAVMVWRLW